MKIRNILIAVVIASVAVCGAVTLNSNQSSMDSSGALVTNRPLGVAYAQEGQTGGAPPPAAAAGDAAAADAAPAVELTDEQWLAKLEEWKNSDPREIVEKKYADLNSKKTNPSNEDDPEQFIPETGRVDPLTYVSSALPDELKPPRSGETDANEVESYLYSQMATSAVDIIGSNVDVYNVIQIGLQKIVSVAIFGGRYGLSEGESFSFDFASEEGWPITMTFIVTKATSNEVIMTIIGEPQGSNVSITKNFTYIPR
ncbi:MAG: hypothetical protein M3R04_03825 [bacterium]|nr:hypothetical protein [bacterium]